MNAPDRIAKPGGLLMISTGLAIVGTTLAAVFLVPQLMDLIRTRDAAGVSPSWAAFGLITNLSWVVYLWSVGLPAALFAPALASATYAMVLISIARLARGNRWISVGVPYLLTMVLACVLGGAHLLGIVLLITPAIQLTPAIAAAFREARPSGISSATWGLAVAEALVWGSYAMMVGDAPLIGYAVISSVGSALVLARYIFTGADRRILVRPRRATA